jgi:hypothetical protein
MGITKLRADIHRVVETPIAHFFRRHLNDPEIITFFNHETGQWVLAYWLHRDRRIVDEIDDLGDHFQEVTPEFVQSLERSRNFYNKDDLKKKYILQSRRQAEKLDADIYQDQERWDWMRKRTKEKAIVPYMVDVGTPR